MSLNMNPKVVTWHQGAAFHPFLAELLKKDNIWPWSQFKQTELATKDKAKQSNYNGKATKPKHQLDKAAGLNSLNNIIIFYSCLAKKIKLLLPIFFFHPCKVIIFYKCK